MLARIESVAWKSRVVVENERFNVVNNVRLGVESCVTVGTEIVENVAEFHRRGFRWSRMSFRSFVVAQALLAGGESIARKSQVGVEYVRAVRKNVSIFVSS